jgi:hypothetical protein
VTAFFLPDHEPDTPATERAYQAIRARAEAETGCIAQERRILGLDCRRHGADCTVRVGDRDALAGHTVIAIVQLSGGGYTIHRAPPDAGAQDTEVLPRSAVYAVTEFA